MQRARCDGLFEHFLPPAGSDVGTCQSFGLQHESAFYRPVVTGWHRVGEQAQGLETRWHPGHTYRALGMRGRREVPEDKGQHQLTLLDLCLLGDKKISRGKQISLGTKVIIL